VVNDPITLPEKVKVAGYNIAIKDWPPHAASASRRYGEFSANEMEIRIDMSMHSEKVLDVFLHELYHAVFWVYGIRDEDKEERICDQLSAGMSQVYIDNPDILRFINESREKR